MTEPPSIYVSNARSIIPKLDDFRSTISSFSPDVCICCETWLDENISDDYLCIPGYNIFKYDRNRHGGGISIWSKQNLCATKFKINLPPDGVEAIWIALKFAKLIIGAPYVPPEVSIKRHQEIVD